jgi:murein DD-endopeptidase MepM/ murein hydrolase activator NlpD
MRVEVSRRHRRHLGHGVALLIVGGLAAGCSAGVSRFTDDTFTASTSNQQSIVGGQTASNDTYVAPAPTDNTYTASVEPMASKVGRSSLPPATSTRDAAVAAAEPVSRRVQADATQTASAVSRHVDPLSRAEERDAAAVKLKSAETRVAETTASGGQPVKAARMASADLDKTSKSAVPAGKVPVPGSPKSSAVLPATPKVKGAATPQIASADAKPKAGKGSHTVAEGDTLSRIARNNGVSVAALKAANGGKDTVRIGQELKIPAAGETVTASAKEVDPVVTASTGPKKTEKLAAASTEKPQLAAYTPPVKSKAIEAVESESDDAAPSSTGIDRMRWPAKGRVAKSRDGIDIQVPEGTAVKAAENGVVIYAGDGLKDFGNTVLVRHENGLVTVYGHAASLNVKRGQKVKRGEQIATSGMSGQTNAPKLHFEVRKDSSPVDPSTYLE